VTPSDDDRIAYLAGEPVETLSDADRADLDELRSMLSSAAMWDEPDLGLEDRIVSTIADAASQPGQRQRAPSRPPQSRPPQSRPPRSRFSAWFRRPVIAFGSLAAAAAVIAVVLVVALSGSSGPAQLRFAMVVHGTPLAPDARGNATLTKTNSGWRIELTATGLPHLQNGRYYQAWLKNAAGILVPIGTFNDARQVTLWSGAPVTQFRTLTVTQQLANGNPVSSGRKVLIGTAMPVH
jgi:hypothetical protein